MRVTPIQSLPWSPNNWLDFLSESLIPVWLASRTPSGLSVPRQIKGGAFTVHAAFIFTVSIPAGVSLPQVTAIKAITIV